MSSRRQPARIRLHATPASSAATPISLADLRGTTRSPYAGSLLVQLAREGTWLRVFARDVSTGGFGFTSATPLTIGETISVWPIDSDEPRSATVRHVAQDCGCFDVGVAFDEPLPYELAL